MTYSACGELPVDFKAKVPFWPGLPWPSQAKAEHLFCSQRKVRHKLDGHPVFERTISCTTNRVSGVRSLCAPISYYPRRAEMRKAN